MTRNVVVTGLGAVAPGAPGVSSYWDMITSGTTATRRVTLFDATGFRSQLAAECDFDAAACGLADPDIKRLDRAAQLALVAAREAWADSGLTLAEGERSRTGVSLGTAVGCTQRLESEYVAISDHGQEWDVDAKSSSPHLYDYFVPSSMAAEVAWDIDVTGPVQIVSTGCTSGIDAIGRAWDLIRTGAADTMVAGATDAPISPITVSCFDAITATSTSNEEPASASKPFDRRRNGFVLGEGSAFVVLEEEEHARRRGARILAHVRGFAGRGNAYHMTGLRPDGAEMAAAIKGALKVAKVDPADIDYVNAHGTATQQNDRHETNAIKAALGYHAYDSPISSIKSMIGHSLGAVGSLEVVACVKALTEGVIPPTANLEQPDPELDLDYVPLTARDAHMNAVLTLGSGFGGFQSAMILSGGERR